MPRPSVLVCCLLPALLVLGLGWPVLQAGFLSDDYLVVYYQDRATGAVHWDRVFGEFARPWFGVRDLYRPLVSLSYGVDLWLHGADARWFHLTNTLLLAGAAAAVAAAAALLAPAHRRLAALAAGLTVALHPAGVEAASWCAARTTGLEQAGTALAWLLFARHLVGNGRRWPYLLALLLALLAKEGAVGVPLSFLALDLWAGDLVPGERRTLRHAAARHLPAVLLVAGYLVFRKLLLGWFTTAEEGHGLLERLRATVALTERVLAPAPGLPWSWAPWVPLALLAALLVLRAPRAALVLACWLPAAMLPNSHVAPGDSWQGRLLFAGVPVLALAVARALAAARRRAVLASALAAASALLGIYAADAAHWRRCWRRGGELVLGLQTAIAREATAAPAAPLALVGLPGGVADVPTLQAKLWGLLGLRPFAARDLAVVGLPGLLELDPAAPELRYDGAPVHAIVAAGGRAAVWNRDELVVGPPTAAALPAMAAASAPPGAFLPALPVPPLAVAAVAVELPAPVAACRLRLLGDMAGPLAFGERTLRAASPQRRFVFDLTRAFPLLVQPFAGVVVAVGDAAAPGGTRVELLSALAPLPIASPLRGAEVPLAELAARLQPPARSGPLRLHLLAPTSAVTADWRPGAPLAIPPAALGQLAFARDLLGSCRVWLFWQTLADDPSPARSALDWCEVR